MISSLDRPKLSGEGSPRRLAELTTARVGGVTERFFEPRGAEEMAALVQRLREAGEPFFLLGGGTNVLVGDGRLEESVVSTRCLQTIEWLDPIVRVEAGYRMPKLVVETALRGLSGLESLTGIPGTVGGAIFGNAGGRLGCIGDVLERVRVAARDGRVCWLSREEVNPRYRRTDLEGMVILEAELRLAPADRAGILGRVVELQTRRRASQPGGRGTMGCFFKNPAGASAGELIDRAGLKGLAIGDVVVSQKHANFLVNRGNGTASDFLHLARAVRLAVEARFSVRLEPEVRIWAVEASLA